MVSIRKRGEEIREFILDNVQHHPKDVGNLTASAFGITRQAVNKHIRLLIEQKVLLERGSTRNKHYLLCPQEEWERIYDISDRLEEHQVWNDDIAPRIGKLPDNVLDIWHYGFTEMFNNAIEHSSGKQIVVRLEKTSLTTRIAVYDDGEGIFVKIQKALLLADERHSVLELSKGKLTTDPANHTGEGIFFSSRMFDDYTILSGNVYFSHKFDEIEDWILENRRMQSGTAVLMALNNNTARRAKQVFDSYTSGEDYGFTKTVVPVRLAQYGYEKLVSRSQAKRLLARIDRFKVVIFDFEGVDTIGQSFADEVFRVFRRNHNDISMLHVNSAPEVEQMIRRALSHSLDA
ncbi:MAG: DUF4325 domain-containing protein [Gammaproteobacteria bacterium]|nr:DUF4325 domain-containing protein [Gammaproteobacteria bacterium]